MSDTSTDSDTLDLAALPGGDQDILAAFAPGLLAALRGARRVVLMANNPAITAADVQALQLDERDVVVSFNTCVVAELLNPRWTHVFVHGFNGPDQYFFGLPQSAVLQALWHSPQARCFTLVVGVVGALSAVPGVSLFRDRIPLPPLWNYPRLRSNGEPLAGPTTGFNALVLFDWLRREQGLRFRLLTLGYSNEAGKLWGGHAWDYERAWLAGADVESIALHKRPWWQRLLKRR